MKKLFFITLGLALLIGIAGLAYRHFAYDIVYLDTANTCTYKNGKLSESTQAALHIEEKFIKNSQVDNYIRQAELKHQCV